MQKDRACYCGYISESPSMDAAGSDETKYSAFGAVCCGHERGQPSAQLSQLIRSTAFTKTQHTTRGGIGQFKFLGLLPLLC